MTYKDLIVPLSMMAAALPLHPAATQPGAPSGGPQTRYCLRVDPIQEAASRQFSAERARNGPTLEVDVDQEWADNGVRVIA